MKTKFLLCLISLTFCGCNMVESNYKSAKYAIETIKLQNSKKFEKEPIFFKTEYCEQFNTHEYKNFSEDYLSKSFTFTYSTVERISKDKKAKSPVFLNEFSDCSFTDEQLVFENSFEGLIDATTTYTFNKDESFLSIEGRKTGVYTDSNTKDETHIVLTEKDGALYDGDNNKFSEQTMDQYVAALIQGLDKRLDAFINLNDEKSEYYQKANMFWRSNERTKSIKESSENLIAAEKDLTLVQLFKNTFIILSGFENKTTTKQVYRSSRNVKYEYYDLIKFQYN